MTNEQARALIDRLADFFVSVHLSDKNRTAYAEKIKPFRHSDAVEAVEKWIDEHDHFPAWSELRKRLVRWPARSVSDQDRDVPWAEELSKAETIEQANEIIFRHVRGKKASA